MENYYTPENISKSQEVYDLMEASGIPADEAEMLIEDYGGWIAEIMNS